ncbi:AfsR/SARP family transcriptional regulator [Actinoallomurus sp. CA-150999]|uniref:AfsR/SARP family transcriptional regulator n=1 Tax=Actinoallomurus sp. CA-150999 TaxID=3239887 RepID=UPI003D91248F
MNRVYFSRRSTNRVQFQVLGPLAMTVDDRPISLPGGKQRTLLAALLLNANRTVTNEEIIEQVWGEIPPHRPRNALHTCVGRLRQALARQCDDAHRMLRTSAAGYEIRIDTECLDLERFRALDRAARKAGARGDLAAEAARLSEALALWRGPALPDVRSEALHRDFVPGLNEERLLALERSHEVGLALGRHDELVGELRVLTVRYPFRERFWRQLMLALYRSGRQAEALRAYERVSVRLRDELGIDPSPELQRIHLAMLRSEPGLRLTETGARGGESAVLSGY